MFYSLYLYDIKNILVLYHTRKRKLEIYQHSL